MSLGDFILKAIASFKPFQFTANIKNLNQTISIGEKSFKVENGQLIVSIPGADDVRIPLEKDVHDLVRPVVHGTAIEGVSGNKQDNIKSLDVDKKVFTRTDIGNAQITLFDIDRKHESIIKKLKPLLRNHQGGKDLGALLASSSVIKVEDKREDMDLNLQLHEGLNRAFGSRGAMIYNLFRSDILQHEILNHVNKLVRAYKNVSDQRIHFQVYWDSIISRGYPSAYFMKHNDSKDNLFKELSWRHNGDCVAVFVFSRKADRNQDTLTWCKEFALSHKFECKVVKRYQLGFTPAIKIRIRKRSHSYKSS